jgi:hypothetical protein
MRSLLLCLLMAAPVCHGAVLNVAFVPDTLSGNPGDVLQFFGTLTNTTNAEVFINDDSFTFAIPGAVDASPFLNNAPLSLGPLGSAGPFEFLDVTIPLGQAPGIYDGVFTVLGGSTDTARDNIGEAAFHVVVNGSAPEPGSMLLFAAGAACLVSRRRRSVKR